MSKSNLKKSKHAFETTLKVNSKITDRRSFLKVSACLPAGLIASSLANSAAAQLIPFGMMNKSAGPSIITTGLVLHLDSANSSSYSGSSTWYDISGNSNHASFTGTPSTSSGSMVFSGGYYANMTNFLAAGRSEFTLEMWINSSSSNSSIAFYDESVESSTYWQFAVQSNRWMTRDVSTGETGGRVNDLNLPSINVGAWTHYCFTYSVSGGFKRIYVNGSQSTSSGTGINQFNTAATSKRIGGSPDGTIFTGSMRQIRAYNFALSDAQVLSNYNNSKFF